MNIFAIADLHLAISTPEKTMEVFGGGWTDYQNRLRDNWQRVVGKDDLVLIAGDISWALHFEDALTDLWWLNPLPGHKVLLKGNHDYWWPSNKKLTEHLPPTFSFIHYQALSFSEVAIGGARLWDDPSFSCDSLDDFVASPLVTAKPPDPVHQRKIFDKELDKLRVSLGQMNQECSVKICMTHYPPLPPELTPSQASEIIESFNIDYCVFGHLHNIDANKTVFGKHGKTEYIFVAGDYLSFTPKKIASI